MWVREENLACWLWAVLTLRALDHPLWHLSLQSLLAWTSVSLRISEITVYNECYYKIQFTIELAVCGMGLILYWKKIKAKATDKKIYTSDQMLKSTQLNSVMFIQTISIEYIISYWEIMLYNEICFGQGDFC